MPLTQQILLGFIPIWVFHGMKDTSIPVNESIEMVEQLKKHGADETDELRILDLVKDISTDN